MPDLTKAENELLKSLTAPDVPTMGKKRMKEVSALAHRLMFLADEATQKARAAQLMSNGFWLVASGVLSETEIAENPQLTDQQRDDLLTMLQLRHYAMAWCEQEGIGAEALPEVEQPPVQGPQLATPNDEQVLEMLDTVGPAPVANFDEYEKVAPSRSLTDSHPLPQPNQQ